MQVWHGLDSLPPTVGPCVAAVGTLDGVHRGHAVLLARGRAHADRLKQPFVVVTFDPHPAYVLRPQNPPKMLGTISDRIALLEQHGADSVLVIPFTSELSEVAHDVAERAILVHALSVSVVVVGENFRFGHKALGTVEMLQEAGRKYGFEVDSVALKKDEVAPFSSTRVRQLLAAGEVAEAAEVLGRPFALTGPVVRGEQRGRDLGFPTANLDPPPELAVPADGVYAGWLVDGTERHPAAISVGDNPTFVGASRRVEAYVLDRTDLDLYGKRVTIEFVAWIRAMEPFAGVDHLIGAMHSDVAATRRILDAGQRA